MITSKILVRREAARASDVASAPADVGRVRDRGSNRRHDPGWKEHAGQSRLDQLIVCIFIEIEPLLRLSHSG